LDWAFFGERIRSNYCYMLAAVVRPWNCNNNLTGFFLNC
jgi:hypothetical protein